LPALLGLAGFALIALVAWVFSVQGEKPQSLAAAPPEARAAATVSGGTADEAPVATPGTRTQLALKFSALSWAEVSDASGRLLLQGLYAGGASRTLSGAPPLRVTVGNTPAVTLQANGQPVPIERLARRDGAAHVLIDAEGHASPAPRRLAHGDCGGGADPADQGDERRAAGGDRDLAVLRGPHAGAPRRLRLRGDSRADRRAHGALQARN